MNLFDNLPSSLAEELVDVLVDGNVRIERIVSTGQYSPPNFWYDQDEHEWVAVLSGAAKIRFESPDEVVELGPGDTFNIPARRRHRVEWTSTSEPTVWLAVFYQP